MKNLFKHLILLLFIVSCTNNDNFDELQALSPKSVTDCKLNIEESDGEAMNALCVNGAKFALPNEIITYAAKYKPVLSDPVNIVFTWTIESGDMEIINIEESIENGQKKSIATIKFKTNFTGDGLFNVKAKCPLSLIQMDHQVGLEIVENH